MIMTYKTEYKVKTLSTNEVKHIASNMSDAKDFARKSKEQTGEDYRITVDGISYFTTESGDDVANLMAL
jgi:hypothetical protein